MAIDLEAIKQRNEERQTEDGHDGECCAVTSDGYKASRAATAS